MVKGYSLNNHTLQTVTREKYLGITISNDLNWSTHINTITNKCNSKLGFLRRNLSRCPQKLKETAYISLVRPTLEYAASVWDPHLIKDRRGLNLLRQSSVKLLDLFMGITGGAWAYGTGAGGAAAPPIRAVCRHEFGQRVLIIRAKRNTRLNNSNLGSVTAVNGKNSAAPQNMDPGKKFMLLPPPPTEPRIMWIPEHFCYYPPPTESIRAKLGLPPQMDVGPYAYEEEG